MIVTFRFRFEIREKRILKKKSDQIPLITKLYLNKTLALLFYNKSQITYEGYIQSEIRNNQ